MNDCNFSDFQMHKKVLDKGKPEDVMPGIKNKKVLLLLFFIELIYLSMPH